MTSQSPGSSIRWRDWTIIKHRIELSDFFSFLDQGYAFCSCAIKSLEKALMRQPCNDGGGSTTAFWREIIPQESSAFKKITLERNLIDKCSFYENEEKI